MPKKTTKATLASFTHPCPKPPHSVMLDLDGTLVNSAEVIAASYNAGLKATGHRLLGKQEMFSMLGPPLDELYGKRIPAPDVPAACDAYRSAFAELFVAHVTATEGAVELLDKLREAGVRTAVITNRARHTQEMLEQCDLLSRVDVVVAVNDGPYAPKPNPDMLYVAMDKLDAIPAETCFVGDSIVDMQAGKTAGLWNIGIMSLGLDAGTLEAAGAHAVTQSLTALPRVLGLEGPPPGEAAPVLSHGARVATTLWVRLQDGAAAPPAPAAAPVAEAPAPVTEAPAAAPATDSPATDAPPSASLTHGARVATALWANRDG